MGFRLLHPDEIEVRIGSCKDESKGGSFLLYKDARCDMKILDEIIGPENWQRKHYECKGNLFCSVGIKCGDVWIWKDDCGSESNKEKEKGEASDSFKRACFNWGIGRELYTAPFIWIQPMKEEKIKFTKFFVDSIKYNSQKEISELLIIDENGKQRFKFPKTNSNKQQLTRENILCDNCKSIIKPLKSKTGDILSPEEVKNQLSGLCRDCYKKLNTKIQIHSEVVD